MLCHKASSNHDYADDDIVVQGYMSHLRQALGVIVESLENYAGEQVILAVDHMRAKLSEFEYLPAINKCMKIIHPEGEW